MRLAGHISLNTTNIYAEIDLEMKMKVLGKCEVTDQINAETLNDLLRLISHGTKSGRYPTVFG